MMVALPLALSYGWKCLNQIFVATFQLQVLCREFAAGLVDQFITSGMIVAVDSGDYCTGMIQEIGSRMDAGNLQGVRIIASCDAAASEAAFVGVPQAMSADASKVRPSCLLFWPQGLILPPPTHAGLPYSYEHTRHSCLASHPYLTLVDSTHVHRNQNVVTELCTALHVHLLVCCATGVKSSLYHPCPRNCSNGIVPSRTNTNAIALQIDVMFSEADEVDVADPELSFVFGRRSEPAQPQIPRFRAAAAKTDTFVAILASEEQVQCLFFLSFVSVHACN